MPATYDTKLQIRAAEPSDHEEILELVSNSGLPLAGLHDHLESALVATDGDRIVGTATLELYPDGALLRSVAVVPEYRGRQIGHALTEEALSLARNRNAPAVFLLTETAAGFFPRLNFEIVTRQDLPPGVQQSIEFIFACPTTATVMRRTLD